MGGVVWRGLVLRRWVILLTQVYNDPRRGEEKTPRMLRGVGGGERNQPRRAKHIFVPYSMLHVYRGVYRQNRHDLQKQTTFVIQTVEFISLGLCLDDHNDVTYHISVNWKHSMPVLPSYNLARGKNQAMFYKHNYLNR